MFDLFGVTPSQVNEALKVHSVNYATVILLLVEKGIVSDEEVVRARIQATHAVDQILAQKQEEVDAEFDEQHPGVRKLFGRILGPMD